MIRHLANSFPRILLTVAVLAVLPAMLAQQPGSSFASPSPTATDIPSATMPTRHEKATPSDRKINTRITDGVLTVDGLVAKIQLNYDIRDASYLYVFVPGVGTVVLSRINTEGSDKLKDAIHGKTLAFSVGGHSFQLTSATPITEGKQPRQQKEPKSASSGKKDTELKPDKDGKGDLYIRLDTAALNLDRNPMFGFGNTTSAPYAWPLSAPAPKDTTAHFVTPPPMPASILPRTVATNTTAALPPAHQ